MSSAHTNRIAACRTGERMREWSGDVRQPARIRGRQGRRRFCDELPGQDYFETWLWRTVYTRSIRAAQPQGKHEGRGMAQWGRITRALEQQGL